MATTKEDICTGCGQSTSRTHWRHNVLTGETVHIPPIDRTSTERKPRDPLGDYTDACIDCGAAAETACFVWCPS